VDVPHKLRQVLIRLTEYRLVAPLKQVTHLSVFPIVVLAVAGQHAMHHSADWIFAAFDQQVNVVGHQAVGVEVEGQLRLLLGKQGKQLEIVILRAEDELSIVAARNDVVEAALEFDSGLRAIAESL